MRFQSEWAVTCPSHLGWPKCARVVAAFFIIRRLPPHADLRVIRTMARIVGDAWFVRHAGCRAPTGEPKYLLSQCGIPRGHALPLFQLTPAPLHGHPNDSPRCCQKATLAEAKAAVSKRVLLFLPVRTARVFLLPPPTGSAKATGGPVC